MKTNKVFLCRIGAHKLQILEARCDVGEAVKVDTLYERESRALCSGIVSDLRGAGDEVEDLFRAVEMSLESFEPPLYILLDESHLNVHVHQSALSISRSGKPVDRSDMRRAIELARKTALIPLERAILYVVPQEYQVDNMGGILNPCGLEGRRLGVKLFLYSLEHSMFRNIQKVFYRSGIEDMQFLPTSWMAAQGALKEKELRGKTLFVDLEDSHAAILVISKFAPLSFKIISYGTDRMLHTLAEDLSLSFSQARVLREKFGSLEAQDGFNSGKIPLSTSGGGGLQTIEAEDFQKRIHDSALTLLGALRGEIEKTCASNPDISSFVVTGSAFSMDGFLELAQDVWSIPGSFRFGLPFGVEGESSIVINPANSALMGALHWIAMEKTKARAQLEEYGLIGQQWERVKGWMRRHF